MPPQHDKHNLIARSKRIVFNSQTLNDVPALSPLRAASKAPPAPSCANGVGWRVHRNANGYM